MEITNFDLQMVAQFLPVIFFSILAFWKNNPVIYQLTAGISMMTGLCAPDIISGQYDTTNFGVTIAVSLIAYSLFCVGMAYIYLFWETEKS